MYRYFVSFTHMSDKQKGCGNVVLESDHKINDFDNLDELPTHTRDFSRELVGIFFNNNRIFIVKKTYRI